MLRNASPEAHNGWVTILDGLNGSVPDPRAIDPRKRRPPTGVTMDGTSPLTATVKRLQLGVSHVPVQRYKAQWHNVCQPTACGLNFTVKRMLYIILVTMFNASQSTCDVLRSSGLRRLFSA